MGALKTCEMQNRAHNQAVLSSAMFIVC
uniref:Uncharacterized protein n=1 Tax=Anguilla anguilla TaxID=7936 RepID=A0A0E9XHR1_ANGAN